jgi:hypothetical protein
MPAPRNDSAKTQMAVSDGAYILTRSYAWSINRTARKQSCTPIEGAYILTRSYAWSINRTARKQSCTPIEGASPCRQRSSASRTAVK